MSLKILFMGTPEFAVPILKSIHNSKYNLVGVYTRPPKKNIEVKKSLVLQSINVLTNYGYQ